MRTIEYRTVDKSEWGEGEWQNEPDKKQWKDQETGYPCLIVRNFVGSLCGYVGVPSKHPLYKKEYNDIEHVIDCHGGLTFSDLCSPHSGESSGICHIGRGKPWWLGFDCAHCGDLLPTSRALYNESKELYKRFSLPYPMLEMPYLSGEYESYKDFKYVTQQVEHLARQLKEIA